MKKHRRATSLQPKEDILSYKERLKNTFKGMNALESEKFSHLRELMGDYKKFST